MGNLTIASLNDDFRWRVDVLEDRATILEQHFLEMQSGEWRPFVKPQDTEGSSFFEIPEGNSMDDLSVWHRRQEVDGRVQEFIRYRMGAFESLEGPCWGAVDFSLETTYPGNAEGLQNNPELAFRIHLDALYVQSNHRHKCVATALIQTAQDTIAHHLRMVKAGFRSMLSESHGADIPLRIEIATPSSSPVRQRVLENLSELKIPHGFQLKSMDFQM